MSDEEVNSKFRKLTSPLLSATRVDAIIDTIGHVEELTDIRQLMQLLVV